MKFNLNSYGELLREIHNSGYTFCSFQDILEKACLLRHDIDISPKLALKMAKIEYGLGIKSTYFFMIRSPFYNIFSRANNEIVKEILSFGHEIALHYDEGYYKSEGIDLQVLVNDEIDILEKNFNIKINVVSFHQPSQKIIDNEIKIKQINTYDKEFFKDIKYLSDSNMIFKEDPIDVIKSEKYLKIQLLIHPIWWVANGKNTEEKWMNSIKQNFELEQKQILLTERAYGNKKNMILEVDNGFVS